MQAGVTQLPMSDFHTHCPFTNLMQASILIPEVLCWRSESHMTEGTESLNYCLEKKAYTNQEQPFYTLLDKERNFLLFELLLFLPWVLQESAFRHQIQMSLTKSWWTSKETLWRHYLPQMLVECSQRKEWQERRVRKRVEDISCRWILSFSQLHSF